MAYTPYTPTATKFVDVDLPDDTELETSGIGAVDTPMEGIADGLLYVTNKASGNLIDGDRYGTKGTVMDTITGATAETVQLSGTDIEFETTALAVGDIVLVIASFNAYSSAEIADVRMRVTEEDATTDVIQTQTLPAAGTLIATTLQGVYSMTYAGTLTVTIEGVNSTTPNNLYIYGGMNISVVVIRSA